MLPNVVEFPSDKSGLTYDDSIWLEATKFNSNLPQLVLPQPDESDMEPGDSDHVEGLEDEHDMRRDGNDGHGEQLRKFSKVVITHPIVLY
jgi:hypothetical protein